MHLLGLGRINCPLFLCPSNYSYLEPEPRSSSSLTMRTSQTFQKTFVSSLFYTVDELEWRSSMEYVVLSHHFIWHLVCARVTPWHVLWLKLKVVGFPKNREADGGRVQWSAGVPAASRPMICLPEVCKLWWMGKPQTITDHLARRPKFQNKGHTLCMVVLNKPRPTVFSSTQKQKFF
jgi:hypothetical protein